MKYPVLIIFALFILSCDVPKTLIIKHDSEHPIFIDPGKKNFIKKGDSTKSSYCLTEKKTFQIWGGFGAIWTSEEKAKIKETVLRNGILSCDSKDRNDTLKNCTVRIRGGRKQLILKIKTNGNK